METQTFGLIGYPLGHSFSKKYFDEKFKKEKLSHCSYRLFEINTIERFPILWEEFTNLRGLNVTIPYKEAVIDYIDQLSEEAVEIGSVNVIKKQKDGSLKGFNSDYYGFKMSFKNWLPVQKMKTMILGTGGASKAVQKALKDMGMNYILISRNSNKGTLTYNELSRKPEIYKNFQIIINTTPLGMKPDVNERPPLDYNLIGSDHLLFDLVYNPEMTAFLKEGQKRNASVKNGLEMLYLQAERSWEIWNS